MGMPTPPLILELEEITQAERAERNKRNILAEKTAMLDIQVENQMFIPEQTQKAYRSKQKEYIKWSKENYGDDRVNRMIVKETNHRKIRRFTYQIDHTTHTCALQDIDQTIVDLFCKYGTEIIDEGCIIIIR
jgi:endo-beta-N-acetylglucosaminidase D